MPNPVYDLLTKAQDLIRDPKNWTKGRYALNPAGVSVQAKSPSAVCWCSLGALDKLDVEPKIHNVATQLLDDQSGTSVVLYNDTHTHAEVMELWDKARETAKKFFNCCTDETPPDWNQFDNLELGGCIDDEGTTTGGVSRAEADFFTIYGHLKNGGCEAITDIKDFDDAQLILVHLSTFTGLPNSIEC